MAVIFESDILKKEFDDFYQRLIPSLNSCENCGIFKCSYCIRFTVSCSLCRRDRCKKCFAYKNSINFFLENCSEEQWDYICNFVHDLLNVSWMTCWYFKDLKPINSSIRQTSFIISNDPRKNLNRVNNNNNNKSIYYLIGNRKYKFYSNN